MAKVEISKEYCKSCGLCIHICPKKILKIGTKSNAKGYFAAECVDEDQCIGCTLCATICPDVAIEVYR